MTPLRPYRSAPSVEEAAREGTLVLLADDHPMNRMVLSRQLNLLGYAVDCAEDGAEALQKWASGRFAALVTDCNMPAINGYELARRIRQIESAQGGVRVPIIACTANALRGEAEACFEAGMDDYLAKPVHLAELQKKLARWLPLPEPANDELSQMPAMQPQIDVDSTALRAISGGEVTAEHEMLREFQRVNDEDAAALYEGVRCNDLREVGRASHRMKGASGLVGMLGLAHACERVEDASRDGDTEAVRINIDILGRELLRANKYINAFAAASRT